MTVTTKRISITAVSIVSVIFLFVIWVMSYEWGYNNGKWDTIDSTARKFAAADIYDYKSPKFYILGETMDLTEGFIDGFRRRYGVELVFANSTVRNEMDYVWHAERYNVVVAEHFVKVNGITISDAMKIINKSILKYKSRTAQQVDSAEASTIAVPPSAPSGSPR